MNLVEVLLKVSFNHWPKIYKNWSNKNIFNCNLKHEKKSHIYIINIWIQIYFCNFKTSYLWYIIFQLNFWFLVRSSMKSRVKNKSIPTVNLKIDTYFGIEIQKNTSPNNFEVSMTNVLLIFIVKLHIPFSLVNFSKSGETFCWSSNMRFWVFFDKNSFIKISNLGNMLFVRLIQIFPVLN